MPILWSRGQVQYRGPAPKPVERPNPAECGESDCMNCQWQDECLDEFVHHFGPGEFPEEMKGENA